MRRIGVLLAPLLLLAACSIDSGGDDVAVDFEETPDVGDCIALPVSVSAGTKST